MEIATAEENRKWENPKNLLVNKILKKVEKRFYVFILAGVCAAGTRLQIFEFIREARARASLIKGVCLV